MSNRLYAAVLATFALLFLGNGIGLYNTFAWFRDLAPNGEVLPASFAWAISLIVLRMIVCAVSMGILVVAKGRRTALVASIAGVSTLLLIALVNAIPLLRVMRVADVPVLTTVLPFVAIVLWLSFLLWQLTSNYALERTDSA
ncbi:MAG: hypothetical protein KDJ14_09895 [Xanthomonadales bacterium]|nr:hypothetical protein [Xanthomonadales bacterium]